MFLELENVRIYYELRGKTGSRVLLLHGWGCSSRMMDSPASALEPDHQVLVIDFPGHGESSRPPEPWGVPEYASCLKNILEKTGFTPCAAVGHSFGCRVAAWAASEWPELFTRLVFTGAAGLKAPQTPEKQKKAEAYRRRKSAALAIRKIPGFAKIGSRMMESLMQRYGSADYNALDEEMKKTFVRIVNLDLRERYSGIKQSTLLIWGDQDTETPLWMGREIEKLIPDAGLVILEGGTHFAYLEQPARFNTIIHHFLTEA